MSGKTGLGKGLGSLIPETVQQTMLVDASERVQKLTIDQITPNPTQPRRHFDPVALGELSRSLKRYGVLQPLVASPYGKTGKAYMLIAGERRWRAAQLAGIKTVPVIVRTAAEQEQLELALVENVQRVDLSALEQARTIESLHQQFNMTYAEIAERLSKAETTVHNVVRLLQLPVAAQQALESAQISEGHARQILALKPDQSAQATLLQAIVDGAWSVRQAEHYVQMHKKALTKRLPNAPLQIAPSTVVVDEKTKHFLRKKFGTSLRISQTKTGGRIELSFRNEKEYKNVLKKLGADL
jgi:ParB family chromosome partitioning protein